MKCPYCKKASKTTIIKEYDDSFLGIPNVVLLDSITQTTCVSNCSLNNSHGFPAMGTLYSTVALKRALEPVRLTKVNIRFLLGHTFYTHGEKNEIYNTRFNEKELFSLVNLLAEDLVRQKILRMSVVLNCKNAYLNNLKQIIRMNLLDLDYGSKKLYYKHDKKTNTWKEVIRD